MRVVAQRAKPWQDRRVNAPDVDRPTVVTCDPRTGRARVLLREYLEEVASRYHGRPLTAAEHASALGEMPGDDLVEPRGVLLIAHLRARDVGCAGMRFLDDGIGEVTSLFVVRDARRQGVAARLLDQLEAMARDRGLRLLRLDTRHDLIEARRLYSSHGFREVEAFNRERYAEHWFAKALNSSANCKGEQLPVS